MSKFKTTKKLMNERYDKILSVSYCNMQNLLRYEEPIAYSIRSEGWSCDYYYINEVLISTGYAPMNSKNVKSYNYDMLHEYDEKARNVIYDYNLNYEDQKRQVEKLLNEFIENIK